MAQKTAGHTNEQYREESFSSGDDTLMISNRRYLGSKQKLLDFIDSVVREHTEGVETVADIFAGTGVVAHMFQEQGKNVIVNDILHSNLVTYYTWFGSEKADYDLIKKLIGRLNELKADEDNYVSLNFGDRYFSMENARKIGAVREAIEDLDIGFREKCFLLTSLLYAMDKAANTVGHYDSYRRNMDTRKPLRLRVPGYSENPGSRIYSMDANRLVRYIKADLVYIDTPYNSRQYGDAYHLLENITDWHKPDVTGVAKKMPDREHIKSDYSTQKAPEAFDDLIRHTDARYILVSYNNMAQKGNGRSNAKISNEEIISSLEKRGEVQVFDTPFKAFTTGKTDIEDHRELLYLCRVTSPPEREKLIRSAVNYTGSKYRLLPQILPSFPEGIRDFYDVFAGGASVAVNARACGNIIINDTEPHLMELFKYMTGTDTDIMVGKIREIIDRYGLSDTHKNGYAFYGAESSRGLRDVNRPAYERLRADYNKGIFEGDSALAFYVLTVFSFNNQIRFNGSGDFNTPAGKRDFNSRMESKLRAFSAALASGKFILKNEDFRILLDSITDSRDFVYLDPPYLISTASYNEGGGWSPEDEKDLLHKLDSLNERGVRFALSNVTTHKGRMNTLLMDWSLKYNVHRLDFNYDNSNYQSTASGSRTVEVLITNY